MELIATIRRGGWAATLLARRAAFDVKRLRLLSSQKPTAVSRQTLKNEESAHEVVLATMASTASADPPNGGVNCRQSKCAEGATGVRLWALLTHSYGDKSRLTGEHLVNNSTDRRRYAARRA